jgi:TolB-like protein/predicted Ser/Thr protein kinase
MSARSVRLSLVGRTLAHYRINTAIGAGGMGEVYRATDAKLGREIALKVLPSDMAGDPDRLGRFQREARAVAALNHPNVVTLYSVEESDGVHFLTMELIEGQPLDRLIPANGLSVERIVEIAGALAEALTAAHEKGILHRDLKPANVMVTNEGRVKVLDFGLAKDVSAESSGDATLTSAGRTQAGMVMGTPAYMSPEQISGRTLDHRTDIFSLGVILHEMATGRRPFEATSSAELVSSILRDTPPLVTDARPDLPGDLARVIRRCLEKDQRHRMQTARDVSNEFRDMTRPPSHSTPTRTPATHTTSAPDSGATRSDEGFWVAVLPFKYSGGNVDLAALAEGLTDDIVTNMSKFSYLRVVARSSTAQYAQRSIDVRAAAKELGARFVMEGSIRHAGAKVRIAAQLVDATSGAGLWAETYDRSFTPEATLDVLDDVVPRIVATIGDAQGILAHSMTEALRNRDPESLTPYEALLRSFGFHQRVSEDEHLAGITALESAVKKAPGHADCWAMLSWLYRAEYTHGYHPRPDSMDRSLAAARRAVNLAPSSQLAHAALASAHFFRGDLGEFRAVAERALALNQMQGYTTAFLGLHFAYSGDWERGCSLAERATQLNPNHPGWFWLPLVFDAYRQHDGERALQHALKVNMPGLWTAQVALTVVNSQLGKMDQARCALRALLAARPGFAARAQEDLSIWWQPEMVEQMLRDLRKAGLGAPEARVAPLQSSGAVPVQTASGEARATEGFWVAVLPFRATSGDADLEALADGLSEDVTTGLSRFPYLQVIAHNSAMAYKGRPADIRAVGRELGARYVIEGSIRKRGRAIRVSAQLMDAVSGTQLWAESYDREITDAGTFQIQDDLTDHIVTSVGDGYGVLVRSMAAPTRDRNVDELSASELVLRHYAFMQQVDPQEHAVLRAGLERALEREPNHANAWACLSGLYELEYFDRFNALEKPLERARQAAWRAVKLDPACQAGWKELAAVHFFSRDFTAFRETAERAMSINPRDGSTLAYMAIMIAFSGDWERGVSLARRAIDLNRHHPGWYQLILFHHHYRKGDYEAALQTAKKINMPEFHWMQLMTAAACGMLDRHEEARTAIESLRKYNPAFLNLENVRQDIEMWDPDKNEVESFLQGLQKAGLTYASADSPPTDPDPNLKSGPTAAAT